MKKQLLCILLVISMAACSGCRYAADTPSSAAPTLPPAEDRFDAPLGDEQLQYASTVPLLLPSLDGQRLLTEYVTLPLNHAVPSALAIVQALLDFPGGTQTSDIHYGAALSLFGPAPVEVSSGVCTVNLSASALQLSQENLYKACTAITASLCQLEDVHYVNFLVAGQAVSMDITGSLPLGSQTTHPGEELTVLWEQMTARRAPLGENPAYTPVTSAVTLYFPLADGSGIAAETRNLTFPGQSPDQLAAGLLNALSAGAQYLSGAAPIPQLSSLLSFPAQSRELENGGRQIIIHFSPMLDKLLAQANVDMPCFISALTCTLTTFIPSVSSVQMYIGETPLTSLYSAVHGNLIFQNGVIQRQQLAPYLMEQATLYFGAGERLRGLLRSLPYQHARNPRTLLLSLIAGPSQAENKAGYEPVLPTGLTQADILGFALDGDTLLLNLSSNFAETIAARKDAEQQTCYSIVNTLGSSLGAARVRFFFDGRMRESLGGMLYWGGEFLVNPSMID